MLGTGRSQKQLDKREAFLAALPPILLGLGILVNALVVGAPWYTVPTWRLAVGIATQLTAALALLGGGLLALVRGLPDWGYTWAGAALTTVALGVNVAAEERAEVGLPLVSPAADVVIVILLMLAGLTVLFLAARRGWSQAGLVSIGLSAVLALSLCATATNAPFYRYDLAILVAPLALLIAVLIYLYARRPGPARIAAIVAVGGAGAAAALIVDQAWRAWLAARGRPSPLLPLLILLIGSLLAGPALGVSTQFLRRATQKG